jgi:hypothetical protein
MRLIDRLSLDEYLEKLAARAGCAETKPEPEEE